MALGVPLGNRLGLKLGDPLGTEDGFDETGLAVGSENIGTTVFGASVFTQVGSHGTTAWNATVLCPSVMLRLSQSDGTNSESPEATLP